MLNLTLDDTGRQTDELETPATFDAKPETRQQLSHSERNALAAKSGGYWKVLGALLIGAAIAGSLALPLGFGAGVAFVAASLAFMLSLNFPIAENRGRYVRDDIELGTKAAVSGRVVAMRIGGGRLRSHCVLTLLSDRTPAHTLQFKLPRSAYAVLRQEQPVTVWYAPSSGIVLELNSASYRYRLGDNEHAARV
ncbi:hypothetical protein [Lysobacter sp. CA199]|uniref:hypothetical protein n=1 Tax=Lysobacter sp. CA199 TaxID=3455608 RepID=UPI003F8CFDD9